MSRLLFVGVGGGDSKRYILDALREYGYELVVIAERAPAWIGPYVLHHEVTDLADTATAIDCATSIGAAYAVDGVFTCDEAHVELTAEVARRLGLPGPAPEAAVLCRDKYAMRQRLAEAGIPSAHSVMVATAAEALRTADLIGYPVVLKPRNLAGSIGVVRADGPDDIVGLFEVAAGATMARIGALPGLLVEEYLDGPEYSIESIVIDGVTHVCGITEKVLGYEPYFEEVGHFSRPVDPEDPLDARLTVLVGQVHRALGFTGGATHCEVRLTGDGPRVIEIAGRLGGDRIPVITQLATGIDLLAAAVAAATGQPADLTPKQRRVAGIRMVYPDHDGVIRRLETKDGLGTGLVEIGWYASVGQRVALPPNGYLSRLAYLIAVGHTRDEVSQRLDGGESMLVIEIEPTGHPSPAEL
jgi:biotin carboxylase